MATVTASKKYSYEEQVGGKSLAEWVDVLHLHNCSQNGWYYRPLRPGAFGYDNLVYTVAAGFESQDRSELGLARAIHQAWAENYRYWRDHQPYLGNKIYFKASKPLGDDRRNLCAQQTFDELPEDEQEKDLVLARCLLSFMSP